MQGTNLELSDHPQQINPLKQTFDCGENDPGSTASLSRFTALTLRQLSED